MDHVDRLYQETLDALQDYPGARQFAQLCCKLPNFYHHAQKDVLAVDVLTHLVKELQVRHHKAVTAPQLMRDIALAWRQSSEKKAYLTDMDGVLQAIATHLLTNVTDSQRKHPH